MKTLNAPVHYEIHRAPISGGRIRLEVILFEHSWDTANPISKVSGLPYNPAVSSADDYPDISERSPRVRIVGPVDWIDKLKGRNTQAAKEAIATAELARWAERQIAEGILKIEKQTANWFAQQRSAKDAASEQLHESDTQGDQ